MKALTIEDIGTIGTDIDRAVRREREALDRERQRIALYNDLAAQSAAAGGSSESTYPSELEAPFLHAMEAVTRARRGHFQKARSEKLEPALEARWATFEAAYRAAVLAANELPHVHRAAERLAAANGSSIYGLCLPEDGISARLLDDWRLRSGFQPAVAMAEPVRPKPLSLAAILQKVLGTSS